MNSNLPPTHTHILIVDRNPRNLQLLMQVLDGNGFQTTGVPDLAQFDALIAQPDPFALALIDVDGFDATIWERCRQLHERQIEVLLVVGRRAIPFVQLQGAHCMARAVLPKPLSPKLLTRMVRDLVEELA